MERAGAAQVTVGLVDDDPIARRILRTWLTGEGHEVIEMETGAEALAHAGDVDVLCLDLGLDDVDGIDLLRGLHASHPTLTILVVTNDRNLDTAVEAMRRGAYDYVTKPLERPRVLSAVARAVERTSLLERVTQVERGTTASFADIVGQSAPIAEMVAQIECVLDSDISICVRGESGTGKELVARAVHTQGRRRKGPFVAINCASIPQSLQESELFGHERGAFTGALGTHKGRFEQANGGTLFLDEIGEMSPMTQASLLRSLQDRSIRRVGGVNEIPIDVRVVCATHRDLEAEVKAGRFREDLYFRLVVYTVVVPPLRERQDDIPHLVAHLLAVLRPDVGRAITHVTPEALEVLIAHPWPGNVRELRNVIHRAMVSCRTDTLDVADLPPALRSAIHGGPALAAATGAALLATVGEANASGGFATAPAEPAAPAAPAAPKTMRELEREAIARALEECGDNVTRAAKMLGLGRATVYRRLAELQKGRGGP